MRDRFTKPIRRHLSRSADSPHARDDPSDPDLSLTALKRVEPDRNMARFYLVGIEPDLFGRFAVVLRFGRLGTQGLGYSVPHRTWGEAEVFRARRIAAKMRRGYALLSRPRQTNARTQL